MKLRFLTALAAAPLLLLGLGPAASAGGDHYFHGTVDVRALVAGTFPSEIQPWRDHYNTPIHVQVAGLRTAENPKGTVDCTSTRNAVCLTLIGTTSAKSGPSTMALALDSKLRTDHALKLLVGIAGISTGHGTLGGGGFADRVVDTDLGTNYVDPRQAHIGNPPADGWDPFDEGMTPYDQAVYTPDPRLVSLAVRLAPRCGPVTCHLANGAVAKAERGLYWRLGPGVVSAKPSITHCDVRSSNSFWVGADQSARQDRILSYRVEQVLGHPYTPECATSAFEDSGWMSGWEKRQIDQCVDRTNNETACRAQAKVSIKNVLTLRTGSDFENEIPGTSPAALYDRLHSPEGFAGFGDAVTNEFRGARPLVDAVVAHPGLLS